MKKKMMILAMFTPLVILTTSIVSAQNKGTKPAAERITNGPVVKNTTGNTTEIAWSTDAPGSSIVKYGTKAETLNETAEAPWGGKKEANGDYNHSVWLKNLKPNTTYYYQVETTQGAGTGTQTQSQTKEFKTEAK